MVTLDDASFIEYSGSRVKELMDLRLSALEMDIKLQLIQELIP